MSVIIRYAVDIPLKSPAVVHVSDTAFGKNYEPSDEAAEWLDNQVVHWYYEPLWGYGSDGCHRFYQGLRFYLPCEKSRLMFKLTWGGDV